MKRGILFALALLLCGGIACAPRKTRYSETRYDLFDTVTVLTGYAESEAAFSETANRVFEELAAYHALFDIYHDAERNNLKTVNDCAGGDPVPVDPAIIDLLLLGREVDALTGHRVNITLGAVLALWHDARTEALEHPESAAPPSEDALRDAARHTGFDLLLIDEAAGTVRLTDPGRGSTLERSPKGMPHSASARTCRTGIFSASAETSSPREPSRTGRCGASAFRTRTTLRRCF